MSPPFPLSSDSSLSSAGPVSWNSGLCLLSQCHSDTRFWSYYLTSQPLLQLSTAPSLWKCSVPFTSVAMPLAGVLVLAALESFLSSCLRSGYHHKMPQSRWLIVSEFWKLKVQEEGARKLCFWEELSPWRADGCPLANSLGGLSSVCLWSESSGVSSSSYKDTCPVTLGSHPYDLF